MTFPSLKLGNPRRPKLPFAASLIFVVLRVFLLVLGSEGQQSANQQTKPPDSGMGVATGGAHPAVKDSLSRPITAGGFVDGATVVFSDITKQAGLEKFLHRSGTPEKSTILETIGSGVALIDYDNDGWLDIYL